MRYHFESNPICDLVTFLTVKRISAAALLLWGWTFISTFTDVPSNSISGLSILLAIASVAVSVGCVAHVGHVLENDSFNSAGVSDLFIGPIMTLLMGEVLLCSVVVNFTIADEGGAMIIMPILGGIAGLIYLIAVYIAKYGSVSSSIDWKEANREVRNSK